MQISVQRWEPYIASQQRWLHRWPIEGALHVQYLSDDHRIGYFDTNLYMLVLVKLGEVNISKYK